MTFCMFALISAAVDDLPFLLENRKVSIAARPSSPSCAGLNGGSCKEYRRDKRRTNDCISVDGNELANIIH